MADRSRSSGWLTGAGVRAASVSSAHDLQHRSVAAEIVMFLEAVRLGSPPEPLLRVAAGSW